MMSNSPSPRLPLLAIAGPLTRKFFRARLMAELVEDAVDHLRLLAGEEGVAQVYIFGDHHARRHVRAHQHFVGAGAQDRAENRVDAVEPPTFRQMTIDERIDAALLAHHALDDVTKKLRLCVAILAALDLLAQAVGFELGDNAVQIDGGHVHLIERLHGGKACRGARLGISRRLPLLARAGHQRRLAEEKCCSSCIRARQARAASPPLLRPSTLALAKACSRLSQLRMPLPSGTACSTASVCRPAADSRATIS